jgi:molybdopterin converting factor small subunit
LLVSTQVMKIQLTISGRNYDVAESIPHELALPEGASVQVALERLAALLPNGYRLPDACLVAVSGQHLGTLRNPRPRVLRDGDELLLLAPVAGG